MLDVASLAITTLADDAASWDPPVPRWNDAGTHLLVEWPVRFGI